MSERRPPRVIRVGAEDDDDYDPGPEPGPEPHDPRPRSGLLDFLSAAWHALVAFARLEGRPTAGRYRRLLAEYRREKARRLALEVRDAERQAELDGAKRNVEVMTRVLQAREEHWRAEAAVEAARREAAVGAARKMADLTADGTPRR